LCPVAWLLPPATRSGFNPTNGFVLSWIPIARIVHRDNASALLDLFGDAAAKSSAKSWYHDHGGGGYEDVGATEAVNSLLLLSVEGAIHLFPGWPLGEGASFTALRAYGAFVVSASVNTSGVVGVVRLLSEAGATCTIASPWPAISGTPTVVTEDGGRPVAVTVVPTPPHGDGLLYFAFNTSAGTTYTIHRASSAYS
jgi:hypothetical protein